MRDFHPLVHADFARRTARSRHGFCNATFDPLVFWHVRHRYFSFTISDHGGNSSRCRFRLFIHAPYRPNTNPPAQLKPTAISKFGLPRVQIGKKRTAAMNTANESPIAIVALKKFQKSIGLNLKPSAKNILSRGNKGLFIPRFSAKTFQRFILSK